MIPAPANILAGFASPHDAGRCRLSQTSAQWRRPSRTPYDWPTMMLALELPTGVSMHQARVDVMEDRDFTEVDLRAMLEAAVGFRVDVVDDRFIIDTRHRGVRWEVIVEPDPIDSLLVVITACLQRNRSLLRRAG